MMRWPCLCASPVAQWRRDTFDLTGMASFLGEVLAVTRVNKSLQGSAKLPRPPPQTAGEILRQEVMGHNGKCQGRSGNRQPPRAPGAGAEAYPWQGLGGGWPWQRFVEEILCKHLGAGSATGVAAGCAVRGEVCAGSCGGEARSAQAR